MEENKIYDIEENILLEETMMTQKDLDLELEEEEISETIKLDYTLESPQERNDLVKKIVETSPPEALTPRYLEIMADYIIFAMEKEERKQKNILTDNHMITVNKRETSFEGLIGKLENGENGIYSMISNDKNIIFMPKIGIEPEDIESIPELKSLVETIEQVEKMEKAATGKRRFLLRKQLIELRQNQYIIKNSYKRPIYFMNATKSINTMKFEENISISDNGVAEDAGLISLFDPAHISTLLCSYTKIKESSWGDFSSDSYYLMYDLDNLVESTLKEDYPLYYDIVIHKIDGKKNIEIQELLQEKYGTTHSVEYISSLWRKKIPKLLAEKEQENYLEWYYTYKEKGTWKRCSKCGEYKLANNKFFSKNGASKDGFYSICKSCRNSKNRKAVL